MLPEEPGNDAVKCIGHVGYQHGVHLAAKHVNHASQSMCKCAQGLGLDAGQVDQAHALEVGRTLSEQRLAAIDNHLMSTLHEARRQLNKEGLSAAVSGRNAAPAADSNTELASAYRIWAGRSQIMIADGLGSSLSMEISCGLVRQSFTGILR